VRLLQLLKTAKVRDVNESPNRLKALAKLLPDALVLLENPLREQARDQEDPSPESAAQKACVGVASVSLVQAL
jgi:hypothetical protein